MKIFSVREEKKVLLCSPANGEVRHDHGPHWVGLDNAVAENIHEMFVMLGNVLKIHRARLELGHAGVGSCDVKSRIV